MASASVPAVSEGDTDAVSALSAQVDKLSATLRLLLSAKAQPISTASSTISTAPDLQTHLTAIWNAIALSSRINTLSGSSGSPLTISNATVSGISGLTADEIPDLSSKYLPLVGGALQGILNVPALNASSTVLGSVIATNATSTTFFSTNASTANSTSTTEYSVSLVAGNATSTNFFATAGHLTAGTIDTLTSTAAAITNLIATTITGTNAKFTNATTTNATSTNAFATNLMAASGTITSATTTSLFASTFGLGGNYFTSLVGAGLTNIGNTLSLDFAHVNLWTSLQQFNGNASTTQFSATSAYFGSTATSTFTIAGWLGIGTTSPFAALSVNGSGFFNGDLAIQGRFSVTAAGLSGVPDGSSWMTYQAPNTKAYLSTDLDNQGRVIRRYLQANGRVDVFSYSDAGQGPPISVVYDNSTPTNGDTLGHYAFRGKDSFGQLNTATFMESYSCNVSAANYSSQLSLAVSTAENTGTGNSQPNAGVLIDGCSKSVIFPSFSLSGISSISVSSASSPNITFTNTSTTRGLQIGVTDNYNGIINATGGGSVQLQVGGTLALSSNGLTLTSFLPTKIYADMRSSKQSNYSIVAADGGAQFDNRSATNEVDFTLPSITQTGQKFGFCVVAPQVVKVIAPSATINLGAAISSSGGNISANQTGACASLEAISSTQWAVKDSSGPQWYVNGTMPNVQVGSLTVWGPDTAAGTAALTIANSASTTEFQVFDNGAAWLAGTLTQNSDQRLKTNILALDASSSLAAIDSLNPVSFSWINNMFGEGGQLGLIAQDVQKLFPQLVSTTSATALTPDGTLGLNYTGLIAPIIGAIQGIAHITGDFQKNLIAWLGNSSNGIQDLYAGVFHGQEADVQTLCIGSTCINQQQLATLLAVSGQTSSSPSGGSTQGDAREAAVTSTPASPPVITINGDNPAIIHVGDTYADLGATVTGPAEDLNLGIHTFVGNTPIEQAVLDTSTTTTYHIYYVATDSSGVTATSTRTVVVEAAGD